MYGTETKGCLYKWHVWNINTIYGFMEDGKISLCYIYEIGYQECVWFFNLSDRQNSKIILKHLLLIPQETSLFIK